MLRKSGQVPAFVGQACLRQALSRNLPEHAVAARSGAKLVLFSLLIKMIS
ncbi:MAG: hypothetical protein L6422_09845 [Candidatus Marinimicrobia bacterium]|nr:hypothetical protein [Candidatus Neomarinimicrobiota bacterium]